MSTKIDFGSLPKKLSEAITKLTRTHPFYTSLLFDIGVRIDNTRPKAWTDSRSINIPDHIVEDYSVMELEGVLGRLVLAAAHMHGSRRSERDHYVWNMASHIVTNLELNSGGFVLPPEALIQKEFEDMSVEAVYAALCDDQNSQDPKLNELIKQASSPDPDKSEEPEDEDDDQDGQGEGGKGEDDDHEQDSDSDQPEDNNSSSGSGGDSDGNSDDSNNQTGEASEGQDDSEDDSENETTDTSSGDPDQGDGESSPQETDGDQESDSQNKESSQDDGDSESEEEVSGSGEDSENETDNSSDGLSSSAPGTQAGDEVYDTDWQFGAIEDLGQELSEAEQSRLDNLMQIRVLKAAMSANALKGLDTGLAERILDKQNSWTDWKEEVRNFVLTSTDKVDYSWSRPNRRYLQQELYMPSLKGTEMNDMLVIAVDTSISVNEHQLDRFCGSINDILGELDGITLLIIYCDAEIQATQIVVKSDLPFTMTAPGRGGTDFNPPFEYLTDNDIAPLALLYFTDCQGWCRVPEPAFPVRWVDFAMGANKYFIDQLPFGEVIQMDPENSEQMNKKAVNL